MEVRRAGTASQLAAARRVLAEARRELYLILANDVAADDPAGDAAASTPAEVRDIGSEDDYEADDTEAELGDE